MRNSKLMMPGIAARTIAWVLTFVLAFLLLADLFLFFGNGLIRDQGLHTETATAARVMDAEMAVIDDRIDTLAEQYHFDPTPVHALISREKVSRFARDVVAWWTDLTGKNAETRVPEFVCDELEELIRSDEGFLKNTPKAKQKNTARDQVAAEITQTVTRVVIPLRKDLITLALVKGTEKADVPLYASYLKWAPWLLLTVGVLLAALITLLLSRRISEALLHLGGALGAGGLVFLAGVAALPMLNLTGYTGEISTLLSIQLELLHGGIMRRAVPVALLCLVAGFAMIGLEKRALRRDLAKIEVAGK